jgi:hypothetical protein
MFLISYTTFGGWFLVAWLSENKDRVVAKVILGIATIIHHTEWPPFDVRVFKQLGTSRWQAALQVTGSLDNTGGKASD